MEPVTGMESQYWKDRNVLITGASGFLGSWVTQELINNRANVTILLRDHVPKSLLFQSDAGAKVNIARGKLENYFTIERTLNEYEIDTVFHLGAQAIVQTANRSPLPTFESNIRGTWNILEATRRIETVENVLVASSDKAYGDHSILPYTEDMPLQGKHPYDVSKSCTDLLAQAYHSTYGLPVSITRCGNIYGGGDLNYNRIIPGTIRLIHEEKAPIIRSDGTYIRDYVYVKDVVDAVLTIAQHIQSKKLGGEAFNISTKNKKSVLEIVERILRLMESNLKPVILNQAKGEIKNQYLSTEKLEQKLGWVSHYSLDEGLTETIQWYENHFKKNS